MTVIPAMDIGGTHVTAAHVEIDTRTLVPGSTFREPLDSHAGAEGIVSALLACASNLDAPKGSPWAIALPGPFDYEHGIGRYEGVGKFDALNGYDLRAALSSRLPGAGHLSFHNDAHAFLLGEWWAGAARGHQRAVGITLGTGVGSCFLCDGRIQLCGPGVPPEGRVDLLRHAGGPLEESVSRRAIRRAYARAAGTSSAPEVREIAQLARQGDRPAAAVFAEAFRTLGRVLAPCVAGFRPSVLIVGGSIAAAWDLIAGPLRAGIRAGMAGAGTGAASPVLAPPIHPTAAPLLGAAYLARVERLQ